MKIRLLAPLAAAAIFCAAPAEAKAKTNCQQIFGLSMSRGHVVCKEDAAQPRRKFRRKARPHRPARHYRRVSHSRVAGALVTVQTAAGLPITVASHLAGKFQGLIADLVAAGYKPRRIHCYARGGHVPNSRHYAGAGCDIDQRGWNKTSPQMYRVGHLARKWGLRDGCTFRDCGHIDDGLPAGRRMVRSERPAAYAIIDRGGAL